MRRPKATRESVARLKTDGHVRKEGFLNMRRLFLLLLLITCSAPTSFAQGGDDYHEVEVFVGYSHNSAETKFGVSDPDFFRDFTDGRAGFDGFNASVTRNVGKYVGLKFDISGHYDTRGVRFGNNGPSEVRSSLYNFLGGVQLKNNSKGATFKPFAHALLGAARGRHEADDAVCIQVVGAPCAAEVNGSDVGLAGAVGGGLDIRASRRVDVRAFQVDYNPSRLFGATQHNVRLGVGVVIH
jgi:hypothetical protein